MAHALLCEELEPACFAAVELDGGEELIAEPGAPGDVVEWLDRELEGALMAAVKREFARARANGEALLRAPVIRARPRVGRNEPCPCGSGRKFKRCCEGGGAARG